VVLASESHNGKTPANHPGNRPQWIEDRANVPHPSTELIVENRQSIRRRAALLSVAVGVLMLAIKLSAFLMTQSTAILSDALESVVHIGATLFMYYCVRLSARPPDIDHPYGHGKVEYFSVGFEGGMVALAAVAIFWQAGHAIVYHSELQRIDIGLVLTAIAAVINVVLGVFLLRVGQRTGSAILVADGKHVLSDVYTSVGVLLGIGLVRLTGVEIIDPIAAILLGIFILWTAINLITEAVSGLLDQVDPNLLTQVVNAINEIRDPQWLDVHNLRMRTSGDFTYIDFHLTVPESWTVGQAHQAMDRLEHHILRALKRKGTVMVHLDYPKDQYPLLIGQPITLELATRIGPSTSGVHMTPKSSH
jgi:cation diffusion facilitator family transporter